MTTNPLLNALLASVYIGLVVGLVMLGSRFAGDPDNILMPMSMLSLLVLSVAAMAYLFFYRPVLMLLDGNRADAIQLFLWTVAWFAVFTVLVFAASVIISTMM